MTHSKARFVPLLAFLRLLPACSDDDGSGDVAVNIWGEEFIEDGIPTAAFEDGGSATFTKFLIAIGTVSVDDTKNGNGGSLDMATVYDLVVPGPHDVGTISQIAAVTHDDFAYRVVPVTSAAIVHASTTNADAQKMADMGWSIYVEGSFVSGADTKTFAWGFAETTHYDRCVDVSADQELSGVVVVDGGVVEAQLTIHGDHFFYDDLQSPDALLRTEALAAADADADGVVTLTELDAVKLADIGMDRGPFGVAASDVNDLGAYMRAATRTLGHFNGEGHCEVHEHGG